MTHLRELGLPVCSKVFIAKTSSKLEVSEDSTRHEQLLILLRALRERISKPLSSGRDEKLPGSFRSGLKEHWSLHLAEAYRSQQALTQPHNVSPESEPMAEGLGKADLEVT
jgi:hypothetical protein